jgi:hypothetical protein
MSQERALTPTEVVDLKSGQEKVAAHLGIRTDQDPGDAMKRLTEFVRSQQQEYRSMLKRLSNRKMLSDMAFAVGASWGELLCREFGWEWVVIGAGGDDSFAVSPADRSLVVYPIRYVRDCLNDASALCTIALAGNMLRGGRIPAMPRGQLEDVMAGVRHVVPPS